VFKEWTKAEVIVNLPMLSAEIEEMTQFKTKEIFESYRKELISSETEEYDELLKKELDKVINDVKIKNKKFTIDANNDHLEKLRVKIKGCITRGEIVTIKALKDMLESVSDDFKKAVKDNDEKTSSFENWKDKVFAT